MICFKPLRIPLIAKAYFYYFSLVGIFIYALYYAWGLKGFLDLRLGDLKLFLVPPLAFILWTLIFGIILFSYIYGNKTWKILSVLSEKAFHS